MYPLVCTIAANHSSETCSSDSGFNNFYFMFSFHAVEINGMAHLRIDIIQP